ncbi:hypothetical protein NE683_08055 [Bariatricus massiliensis]|uniref:Uncharacterized protein n=1 Tax=Bariatricus massiliensis TaxID=1745713 RepID=A0ABS8DJT6_9FIRM|nr:hypothetical protein [Bariatricus massiliensis]MCB7305630.1 hypothetical protein [Bariatricus massiliensis]MCB7376184.1 hypothetical protein [Bariatricus massiliensis]MCB7388702.1 hypothetical protein [Bariatricus massiliensis]MCB7412875.1 hypothetical protein [Bariatricus massiliensis]MCQ5253181.1 hypothetical protein [Bariatricus massiliensis]
MGRVREEDEFQKIANYLDRLHFKKSIYGASLEDVYSCMKELDRMYRDVLDDYKDSLQHEMEERKREIEQRESKVEEMMGKLSQIQRSRKEDQEKIKELEAKLQDEERMQKDYKEKTALLAETLTDTQKNKAFVLEQANREARAIIFEANRKAEDIIEQSKAAAAAEEEQSKSVLEEISRLRGKAYDNLKLIEVDLQSLSEDVVRVQNEIKEVPDHIDSVKVEIGHIRDIDRTDIMRFDQYEAAKK